MKKILFVFSILLIAAFALLGCTDNADTQESVGSPSVNQESCNHIFDEWRTVKIGTCIENGEQTRLCQKCLFFEKREAPRGEHSTSDVGRKEATCISEGHEQGVVCSLCKKVISGMAVIPKKPHNYVNRKCTACNEAQVSVGLVYTEGEDGYTVSGMGECKDTVVIIPKEYNGKLVVSIGKNAFEQTDVEAVELPSTVTEIKEGAFKNCSKLSSITISEKITKIGSNAFLGCNKLVTEENDVEYVSTWAVGYLSGGSSVSLREGTTGICDNCFSLDTKITEVHLPSSVKIIGSNAFLGCSSLASVNIPTGIELVGMDVFEGCSNAISVENGVKYVDKMAIGVDASLRDAESINIKSDTLVIGNGVFNDCTSLKSVALPDGLRVISSFAFNWCSSITSIDMPSELVTIGDYAFANCNNLRQMSLGEKLKYVGRDGISSATAVTVSENNPYFKSENGALVPRF